MPSSSTFGDPAQARLVKETRNRQLAWKPPPKRYPTGVQNYGRSSVPPGGRPSNVDLRSGMYRGKPPARTGTELTDIDLDKLSDFPDKALIRLCARAARPSTELTPELRTKLYKVLFYAGRNKPGEVHSADLATDLATDDVLPSDDDIEPPPTAHQEAANAASNSDEDLELLRAQTAHAVGVDSAMLASCDADALVSILDHHVKCMEKAAESDFR
mmetsp:Transcript_4397/g.13008  ORF Transcript_4397/g.13008 Transcript_4397/m.13008 type:complete len:215 (+) Transcript_4397:1076-1720(+)